ncbi:uncharacterized protein [Diabrotica undecimpunctata]|uniref:uncharacterized protein n=1 Tax=Diabrotica undecimpunctata TaxID=50387 RepID=UPI003B6416CC
MPCENVFLYAYELKPDIWHLSVVVFNKEYSFGADGFREERPGISGFRDKCIFMGTTGKSECDLSDFLCRNRWKWMDIDYNVLTKNCQHFAQELLDYLGIYKKIPSEYTNLPEVCRDILGPYQNLPGLFLKASGNTAYNSGGSGFSGFSGNRNEIDWTKVIVGSIAAVTTVACAAIETSQRNNQIKNQSVEAPTTYKYPYITEKPKIKEIYDPPNNSGKMVTYRNEPKFPPTNQDEPNKEYKTNKDVAEKDQYSSRPNDTYSIHILIDKKLVVIIIVGVLMYYIYSSFQEVERSLILYNKFWEPRKTF